jgi:hypothetical protein
MLFGTGFSLCSIIVQIGAQETASCSGIAQKKKRAEFIYSKDVIHQCFWG